MRPIIVHSDTTSEGQFRALLGVFVSCSSNCREYKIDRGAFCNTNLVFRIETEPLIPQRARKRGNLAKYTFAHRASGRKIAG